MTLRVNSGTGSFLGRAHPLPHAREAEVLSVIVAVIPAYNEERFIASVVLTAQYYANYVVVVDDGSTDRTADLAAAVGAVVVRQPHNAGKAEALNAGFLAAKQYSPDVIVCLDADAQHEPSEIPAIIKPILDGRADVVIGSRFLTVKSDIPKWRQVGQHALTLITNTLSRTRVTDSQSGFRAFSPAAVEALRFGSAGLSVESEMQFLFAPAGLRVAEVPISVKYQDGNKRNPVKHGMQVLDSILGIVARKRPLLFISLPGVVLSSIGLLLGFYVLQMMAVSGSLMSGTAMLTALLIMSGMLLFIAGITLHSLSHFAGKLREELHETLLVKVRNVS